MSSHDDKSHSHPSRAEGQSNQTFGSAKETLGNVFGSDSLKQSGAEQNQRGKGQESEAQLSDLGSGFGAYLHTIN